MAVQFVSLAPFSLDSSPILENMHRYHTYKMHTSSCQETLRKTMEETLWEVGASRCLQVAGAGSNGLIFSQIDLLAKPPLHPILNKTSQRKEDWHEEFWCLGDWTIHIFILDYPPLRFWNWGGKRWKKKVKVSIQILMQRYAQLKILGYIQFILCIGPRLETRDEQEGLWGQRESQIGGLWDSVAIFPGLRQSVTDLRPADTKMGLNFNDVS